MSRHHHLILFASFMALPYLSQAAKAELCAAVFADSKVSSPSPETQPSRPLNINDLLSLPNTKDPIADNHRTTLANWFDTIRTTYAGNQLKASSQPGTELVQMRRDANKDASKLKTTNDRYYQITDLLMKFNDAHISVELPSTLIYHVGVQLRAAEGKIFINALNEFYPANTHKAVRGEEVLKINGVDPEVFQKSFSVWNAVSNPETSKAMFAMGFGNWKESRGIPLSKFGELSKDPKYSYLNDKGVVLTLKAQDGSVYDLNLPFVKEGIGLIGRDLKSSETAPEVIVGEYRPPQTQEIKAVASIAQQAPHTAKILEQFNELFRTSYKDAAASPKKETNPDITQLGSRIPQYKLPADFKVISLEPLTSDPGLKAIINDDTLFAGTFTRNGERIGLLKIASYAPESLQAALPALRLYIAALKESTDRLIIDQTNNPGGYVIYSDMVIKSLVGDFDPSKHLHFSVKPKQSFLDQYKQLLVEIGRNADGLFTPEEVKYFTTELQKDYDRIEFAARNHKDLSEPITMLVMSTYFERALNALMNKPVFPVHVSASQLAVLSPAQVLATKLNGFDVTAPQLYDKPVDMIINETCFSGGDATPASLQDYGRLRLVGTATAGAGGTVEAFSLTGSVDMNYHMITSLMVRKDGSLVENNRVHPDIQVPLLASDIQDGYSNWFDRVMKTLDENPSSATKNPAVKAAKKTPAKKVLAAAPAAKPSVEAAAKKEKFGPDWAN